MQTVKTATGTQNGGNGLGYKDIEVAANKLRAAGIEVQIEQTPIAVYLHVEGDEAEVDYARAILDGYLD